MHINKTFANSKAAWNYVLREGLPITSLKMGNKGMNRVEISGIGGKITTPSSTAIRAHGRMRYSKGMF